MIQSLLLLTFTKGHSLEIIFIHIFLANVHVMHLCFVPMINWLEVNYAVAILITQSRTSLWMELPAKVSMNIDLTLILF